MKEWDIFKDIRLVSLANKTTNSCKVYLHSFIIEKGLFKKVLALLESQI